MLLGVFQLLFCRVLVLSSFCLLLMQRVTSANYVIPVGPHCLFIPSVPFELVFSTWYGTLCNALHCSNVVWSAAHISL